MHNLPEEDIFPPSAWVNLGTADIEGTDFRALPRLGPIFRRK